MDALTVGMIWGMSPWTLVALVALALLVFPRRIPETGRALGAFFGELRKSLAGKGPGGSTPTSPGQTLSDRTADEPARH